MNFRPAISAPLPWLTILASRLLKRDGAVLQAGKKRLFRLPRSLSVTREGKWFIAVLFFIGIAAINTGNNLLYLVLATLLSLIIVSGILSESTLRGIGISRVLPEHVFKGSPVIARLKAGNGKKIFPSFSFLAAELKCPDVTAKGLYFLKLSAGAEAIQQSQYTFNRRGRFTLVGVKVETRFPFGLFVKGREIDEAIEVMVLPQITGEKAMDPGAGTEDIGLRSSRIKGHGAQIYGLRDYTLQDDSRHIHWKSVARTRRLLVKEFEKEEEKRVFLVFENHAGRNKKEFEDLVDTVASTASALIERGFSVGLKTLTEEIRPCSGRNHLMVMLQTLALIEPADIAGAPRAYIRRKP